ncbi:carbohydrate kinase family protein [Halocatena halophila]|uniref:carbohydrate kinase family protein n=1 Tax=Halocatena halophila TaxID=2814576 RepID=UPI002ED3A989
MTGHFLVVGETLVDLVPAGGDDDVFVRRIGGGPTNVAAGLARLDNAPLLWSCLGDDPMAAFLRRRLDELGLAGPYVERAPDSKTTLAHVTHDGAGDRTFTFYRERPADVHLSVGAVPDEQLAKLDWVVVGGIALATDRARTAILELLERATSAGCTVVYDPNARPSLWTDEPFERTAREVLEYTDIVCGSVADCRTAGFDGETPAALAQSLLSTGVHTVVLTQGVNGSLLRATANSPVGPTAIDHPGYSVSVTDTTGAGDGFLAGLLDGIKGGADDPWRWLDRANAAGALTTTARGAVSAFPNATEIETLQKKQSIGRR